MARQVPAATAYTHSGAGLVNPNNPSNAGANCLQSGCHSPTNPGAGGAYLFAGTITKGGSADPGVAILLTSADATYTTLYSDADGNFYYPYAAGDTVTNGQVMASVCPGPPSVMTNPLNDDASGGVGCNSCHVAGGAAGSAIYGL
jgi:hypothetical protein